MERKYGWKQQKLDDRDLRYASANSVIKLPVSSDLRNIFPPCYDQGQTSSCTGNGVVGALQAAQYRAKLPIVMLSRLFVYYNARLAEGDANQDAGAAIRDVIKGCNMVGVVPETEWPFDESKVTAEPSSKVYLDAKSDCIHFYATVDLTNINDIKVPFSHNIPVVFGAPLFPYFKSDEMGQTGILKMPDANEQSIGGHCMILCGHDDSTNMLWVRNSWGTNWGPFDGYFKMPYDYITKYGMDGWAIRL